MNARDRAQRRWFRFPIDVMFAAPIGESVTDTPLSRWELEYLASYGPMLTGETIPPEDEESRVNALTDEEYQAELAREQAEADRFHAEHRKETE